MLVMIIIVMCPITLDILQHMPRNIQGEEFNLKMICITIYIIIINTKCIIIQEIIIPSQVLLVLGLG